MGRLIVVQPGRSIIESPIILPHIVEPIDASLGVQTAIAETRIEAYRAVRFVSENSVSLASTPSAHNAGTVCGISIEAADPGQYVRFRSEGVQRIDSAQFIPDQPVFSGAYGLLTQNTYGLEVDIQVGTAITATTMLVRIELPVYRGIL